MVYARWRWWLSHSRARRCLHAKQANVGGHDGATRHRVAELTTGLSESMIKQRLRAAVPEIGAAAGAAGEG
jgi:hypothetical protein